MVETRHVCHAVEIICKVWNSSDRRDDAGGQFKSADGVIVGNVKILAVAPQFTWNTAKSRRLRSPIRGAWPSRLACERRDLILGPSSNRGRQDRERQKITSPGAAA